jgi:predicted amidophosphoribosyltransferase
MVNNTDQITMQRFMAIGRAREDITATDPELMEQTRYTLLPVPLHVVQQIWREFSQMRDEVEMLQEQLSLSLKG